MAASRIIGLIDNVTGNVGSDALKHVATPLLDLGTVKMVIRRTADDHPYSGVDRWMAALVDEIPSVNER